MTPALQMLLNTRKVRTEQEVEDEFLSKQISGHVKKEKKPKAELEDFSGFSDNRKKSQLLLMPSQIEIIKKIFTRLDAHNDTVLQRSRFVMALRTDEEVVNFIDQEAVKTAQEKPKILTLD